MNKTEKEQLISRIRELKDIKPDERWVIFVKQQILKIKEKESLDSLIIENPVRGFSLFQTIKLLSWQRKLAYCTVFSFFVIIGLIGFAHQTMPGDLLFPVKKVVEKSEISLLGYKGLRQELTLLNNRINELERISKEGRIDKIPSAINEVKNQASQLAKGLRETKEESGELKEIASSLRILSFVPGTDLTEDPEVKELYKIVIENQIADLEKSTLTEKDQDLLSKAKELFNEARYLQALEIILKIGNESQTLDSEEELLKEDNPVKVNTENQIKEGERVENLKEESGSTDSQE